MHFERFNRLCARMIGRNVHKVQEGKQQDPFEQLDGPNPRDICSHTSSCEKCQGNCGWCAAEVKNTDTLQTNGGGWCSSECVTEEGWVCCVPLSQRPGGTFSAHIRAQAERLHADLVQRARDAGDCQAVVRLLCTSGRTTRACSYEMV